MLTGEKILGSYLKSKKEDSTIGVILADYNMLDEDTAHLAIASCVPLELNETRSWVFSTFDYSLIPMNKTINYYKGNDGLFYNTIVTSKSPARCKDIESSKFIKIGANSYLDQKLDQIWNKEDIDGKKFFIRENDDNIQSTLNELSISTIGLSASFDFQTLKTKYDVGSIVTVYFRNNDGNPMVDSGKVTNIQDDGTVTVRIKGKDLIIPAASIIQTESAPADKNKILDHLKKVYKQGSDIDYIGKFEERM